MKIIIPAGSLRLALQLRQDLEKRLIELNRSECIPFAFRPYAIYEIRGRLQDRKIHGIIDRLYPSLRAIDEFNGKPRVKEFFARRL